MTSLGSPIAVGRTAEIFAWENDCILKLTRAAFPAYLADQEWQQSEAVWKLGAPAPRPMELVEVDGRRGVVFQRIEGQTMSQAMQQSLWRLDHFARILGRLHAELHRLAAPGFRPLHDRIRWALGRTDLLGDERKAAILGLLADLPDGATLCHGDFHPENILLAAQGPLVIDWEGSMRSDPSGDVANTCLWIHSALMFGSGPGGWLMRQIGRRFERVYLVTYQRAHGPVDHLAEWMAVLAACLINEENRTKIPGLERIVRRALPGW